MKETSDYTLFEICQLVDKAEHGIITKATLQGMLTSADTGKFQDNPFVISLREGSDLVEMFNETIKKRRFWLKYTSAGREQFNEEIEHWSKITGAISRYEIKPWHKKDSIKEMVAYDVVEGIALTGGVCVAIGAIAGGIFTSVLHQDFLRGMTKGFEAGPYFGGLCSFFGAFINPVFKRSDFFYSLNKYLPLINIRDELQYVQSFIKDYSGSRANKPIHHTQLLEDLINSQ